MWVTIEAREDGVYINQNNFHEEKLPDETVNKLFKTLGYYLAKKNNLEKIILLVPDENK